MKKTFILKEYENAKNDYTDFIPITQIKHRCNLPTNRCNLCKFIPLRYTPAGCTPVVSGFFILLLFSFFFFSVSAESARSEQHSDGNVLLLTNPKTSETNAFRHGSFLVFEIKADKSVHEGFLRNITDSSLVFDDAQVSLSQINILAGSTKGKVVGGRVAAAVANALLLSGLSLFDYGLGLLIYGDAPYYYWPLGGSIWIAGAVIAGMGYAADWACEPFDNPAIRVRDYRGWDAAVIQEEKQPSAGKQVAPPYQDSASVGVDTHQQKNTLPKKEKKKKTWRDDVYGE